MSNRSCRRSCRSRNGGKHCGVRNRATGSKSFLRLRKPDRGDRILKLNPEKAIGLYRQMLTIRAFEQKVLEAHQRRLVHGAAHTYIGMEAVAVGVCAALNEDDYVTSTHRGHG